jgi:hypothetical protein
MVRSRCEKPLHYQRCTMMHSTVSCKLLACCCCCSQRMLSLTIHQLQAALDQPVSQPARQLQLPQQLSRLQPCTSLHCLM